MMSHVPKTLVPESEIAIVFVRSSGPGGQNVNKTSTKAQLHWNIGTSPTFTDEQKSLIRTAAGSRVSTTDDIVLSSESERSQSQNRQDVIDRLQALVVTALIPKKKRIPIKVSRTQRRKRLESKRIDSRKKTLRRTPNLE